VTESEPDVERLRAALRAAGEGARPREDCPPAERLWATLRHELPAEARREVIDHVAGCGSCSEAWRLAAEMLPSPLPEAPPARSWLPEWLGARPLVPLAAAIALVAALGAALLLERGPGARVEPGYREDHVPRTVSRVPEDEPLPRSDFRLRWSPGPEGALYDVRLTTESLEPIAEATGLSAPEWLVPESALGALPSGARVFWQVEVRLPGGGRVPSQTFVASLR
jgi:hypothetical protein